MKRPARLGLATLLLAGGTEPAAAQTPQALVSNIGQADGSQGSLSFDHAQGFTTGPSSTGYRLTSVDWEFNQLDDPAALSKMTMVIRSRLHDPNGNYIVATLTNPSSFTPFTTDTVLTFTAPGVGIDLEPSTTYYVILDVTAALTGTNRIRNTNSDAEDTGGTTGFSIADHSNHKTYASTVELVNWQYFAASKKIRINGHVKGTPPATANADGSYSVSADWPLAPRGARHGERFRLLFVTSATGDATPAGIAAYDGRVRNALRAGSLTAIKPYASAFKVVGSTQTVAARHHLVLHDGTNFYGGTSIHWMNAGGNGKLVADDYEDFCDREGTNTNPETWWKNDLAADFRNENGEAGLIGPIWTGTTNDCRIHTADSAWLGGSVVAAGGAAAASRSEGPLDRGTTGDPSVLSLHLYGMSPVFVVDERGSANDCGTRTTQETAWTTQDECYIYAGQLPNGSFQRLTRVHYELRRAELAPYVAPEAVFLDQSRVNGNMDITDPALTQYRAFFNREDFTERQPTANEPSEWRTLLSNLHQAPSGTGGLGQDHAQAFTTPANAHGGHRVYSVSIAFALIQGSGVPSGITGAIYTDSSGRPGTVVGTLSNPTRVRRLIDINPNVYATDVRFTAPAGGIALEGGATYWFVLDVTSAIDGSQNQVSHTASDDKDPGNLKFGFPASSGLQRTWSDTGNTWTSSNRQKKIRIDGAYMRQAPSRTTAGIGRVQDITPVLRQTPESAEKLIYRVTDLSTAAPKHYVRVTFEDGALCRPANWGLEPNYFGWFWGRYPGPDQTPRVTAACLQAVLQITVRDHIDNVAKSVSLWLKDNQNGPYSVFGQDDRPFSGAATPVHPDWSLAPPGLSDGDRFRLLVRTSTRRDATSSDIADYDAHVRAAVAAGHADIRQYADAFQAVGSTAGIDARDHLGFFDNGAWVSGVPIHWLDASGQGKKVADDYTDFCNQEQKGRNSPQLWWQNDNLADMRNEHGVAANGDKPWTGSENTCEGFNRPGRPQQLGSPGNVEYGAHRDGRPWGPLSDGNAARTQLRPLYALSPVFVIDSNAPQPQQAEQQQTPAPEVNITAASGGTEGGNVTFQITSNPHPAAALDVSVTVAATGDYGVTPGTRTVTIPTTGSATLTLATTDDSADEPDGSVTLTLNAGTDYTVGSLSSETVAILDDDEPPAQEQQETVDLSVKYADLIEDVRGYIAEPNRSDAHRERWNRVLVALGVEVSGFTGDDAMTASEAATYRAKWPSDAGGVDRWGPVVEALTWVEAQQQPPTPEISITGGSGVTEGGSAVFTISASPVPAAALDVSVTVSQSGDYGVSTETRTVTIPTTGSATLSVTTTDDSADEADGLVTVTLNDDTDYTVSGSQGTATVVVSDDDAPPEPEVSIAGGSGVTEGGSAVFTITASPKPSAALDVSVTVSQSGDYGVSTGTRTVTIPTTGSATLSVATTGDASDEPDGSVTVTVNADTDYTVSGSQGTATVAVSDDDAAPTPEISITGGSWITEGGSAVFTITASPKPSAALAVSVTVSQSGDYGVTTGTRTVSIPATGSATLSVATTGDANDEPDGSVTVTLNADTAYTVSSAQGAATVAVSDDDDAPTPEISVTGGNGVTEGGSAVFTLTASPRPTAALDVSVTVSQSGDYGVTTGKRTVTIPTTGSATLSVATTGDSADEADGSVTVALNTGSGYAVSGSQGAATVAITDDDAPPEPEVSITAGSGITEGGSASFTITASPKPSAALDVSVTVSQSGDYGVSTGTRTVTIPTTGSATLSEATTDDSSDEADGSVTVTLNADTGYTVSGSQGSATVAVSDDDDPPEPEVSITAGSRITEGGSATFTLTASPKPTAALDVSVTVSQSGDYGVTTVKRTVTIPTTGSATLTIATTDDTSDEADGSVTVTVNADTGYTVSGAQGTATVAVSDDDDAEPETSATISIGDASAEEGKDLFFTVTLSEAVDHKVRVHYKAVESFVADNYALAGRDFWQVSGWLEFAAGETSARAQVPLEEDTRVEGDEVFLVVLSEPEGAEIADGEGVMTIVDND